MPRNPNSKTLCIQPFPRLRPSGPPGAKRNLETLQDNQDHTGTTTKFCYKTTEYVNVPQCACWKVNARQIQAAHSSVAT